MLGNLLNVYEITMLSSYSCVVTDELIRQETLNCMERGLLLVRVRDELRMSLAAYENLYDSGVAFGIRKALLSERGKMDIVERVRSQH